MEQFAMVGILLILLDFIPLARDFAISRGSFKSKFIRIALQILLILLVLGVFLILIS